MPRTAATFNHLCCFLSRGAGGFACRRALARLSCPSSQRLALALVFGVCVASAQTPQSVTTRLDHPGGPLYATIAGSERKVADSAEKAWVLHDNSGVLYSGRDGAGGNDNEGQSLWFYDAKSGDRRKLMAEYYVVNDVKEAATTTGRSALLVEMMDTNIDAIHVAVVDPARGEVFCEDGAKLASVDGDTINLAFYGDDDWDNLADHPDIKPQKTEKHDLKELLAREVMSNSHT
ncbi:MAG TPA: hypothetical protein VFA04_20125 [Bryobacteraceae bacterium]|nr:hypothetical protein [Bryobacteraceae bacterium]